MNKCIALASACFMALVSGCTRPAEKVVLYCAQDQEFAEPLFMEFHNHTRLKLVPKFDTEANKSVSLAAELLEERGRARCDVHWNNEILNTIRLSREGVYDSYNSPNAGGYPDWTHAHDGTWQAFAARARVLIVNTKRVPESEMPKSLLDLTQPRWKGQIAMAKPQFGTTATFAACLFEAIGTKAASQFFRDLKANDVQIVAGNKQVASGVSRGDFAMGLTDTDDALTEWYLKQPVALVYLDRDPKPRMPGLGVLYIPNTVSLVRGGPNPDGGRKLIDYLLKAQTELILSESGGYQIPLNPAVKTHPEIPRPDSVNRMAVDFEKAADRWEEVQTFLRAEFAR